MYGEDVFENLQKLLNNRTKNLIQMLLLFFVYSLVIVCMHVCMYMYVCMYVCVCMCVCMYVFMHVRMCVCMYVVIVVTGSSDGIGKEYAIEVSYCFCHIILNVAIIHSTHLTNIPGSVRYNMAVK